MEEAVRSQHHVVLLDRGLHGVIVDLLTRKKFLRDASIEGSLEAIDVLPLGNISSQIVTKHTLGVQIFADVSGHATSSTSELQNLELLLVVLEMAEDLVETDLISEFLSLENLGGTDFMLLSSLRDSNLLTLFVDSDAGVVFVTEGAVPGVGLIRCVVGLDGGHDILLYCNWSSLGDLWGIHEQSEW